MRLLDAMRSNGPTAVERRAVAGMFESWSAGEERVLVDFDTYAEHGYKGNGPVFSLMSFLVRTVSEVEFQYQDLRDKRLYGGPELLVLERPQPTWRTSTLVKWMELDRNIAGNSFIWRDADTLIRLRPDWVSIMLGPDGAVVGYTYFEGGYGRGEGKFLSTSEVAHYYTDPDPTANHKGVSWLSAVAREVDADTYMSKHKLKFFTNAATPNMLVKVEGQLDATSREKLRAEFAAKYGSWENAYKTAILDGGADVTVIGNNFEQMAFSVTQAAGENRLANAAGVPPIVVGFSRGLDAATYSNYHSAMRAYADTRARPNWRAMAQALESIVPVPAGSRLWYDDRYISYLQQDAKDEAAIRKEDALTMESLIRAGFEPMSAAVFTKTGNADDLQHTGLVSVQLLPPGETEGTTSQETNNDDSA